MRDTFVDTLGASVTVRRLVRTPVARTLVCLVVGAAGALVAVPAVAVDEAAETGVDLVLVPEPGGSAGQVGVFATIEDESAFCGALTGVYVSKPTWYTVRTVNCRHSDIFVKGHYLNGSFGPCVLVPARNSRHLGGSLLKPMEDSRIC